jgi:hypothetical protein
VPVLFVGLQSANIPFDGGLLLVEPTFTFALTPFNGAGVSSFRAVFPNSPSLCGESLFMQAMFVDSGGGATGLHQTAQSAGLEWTFGN